MKALIDYIETGLNNEGAPYIIAIDCDGDRIKIRVKDHSCNDRNNDGIRCLSFITNSTVRNSGQWENVTEWVMSYDENNDMWIDKNYFSVEEILADFCLTGFYQNGELIKL